MKTITLTVNDAVRLLSLARWAHAELLEGEGTRAEAIERELLDRLRVKLEDAQAVQ